MQPYSEHMVHSERRLPGGAPMQRALGDRFGLRELDPHSAARSANTFPAHVVADDLGADRVRVGSDRHRKLASKDNSVTPTTKIKR
jgi:hypothetical protein